LSLSSADFGKDSFSGTSVSSSATTVVAGSKPPPPKNARPQSPPPGTTATTASEPKAAVADLTELTPSNLAALSFLVYLVVEESVCLPLKELIQRGLPSSSTVRPFPFFSFFFPNIASHSQPYCCLHLYTVGGKDLLFQNENPWPS
jgi:hypothetical protein